MDRSLAADPTDAGARAVVATAEVHRTSTVVHADRAVEAREAARAGPPVPTVRF